MTTKQIETLPDSEHIRTCQECGHKQKDKNPNGLNKNQMEAYNQHQCKKCKSESLDYGSQNASYDWD